MMHREMTPMYVQDGGFQPPKVEGLLPHFFVLHRMMRRTLAPRIGYSEVILAYERNLLDALMKVVCFDVFEYIVDEIWNIATNPFRSCGFAPYIQFMIKSVTQEKLYKDVCHDSLCHVVPKDPRASHAGSSAVAATAPSRINHNGGAPSAPTTNSGILKMLQGIFAPCRCTDQRLDVVDHHLQIVRHNQEIIHSQQDEPLQEFPDVHVFPPVPDPYGSLTLAELATIQPPSWIPETLVGHVYPPGQTCLASQPFLELTKHIQLLGRTPKAFSGHVHPPTRTCLT
jgi:hypothetical protein